MGLSTLGPKKVRRVERITGLPVEWASVNCAASWWLWRFHTPDRGAFRLGILNTLDETWVLKDSWSDDRGFPVVVEKEEQ